MPTIDDIQRMSPEEHERIKTEFYRGIAKTIVINIGVKVLIAVASRYAYNKLKIKQAAQFNSNL